VSNTKENAYGSHLSLLQRFFSAKHVDIPISGGTVARSVERLLRKEYTMAIVKRTDSKQVYSQEKLSAVFICGKVYKFSEKDARAFNSHAVDLLRRRAKKLGVPHTITMKTLRDWWLTTPDVCAYCGSTIDEYLKISTFLIQYNGNDHTITRFKNAFNLPSHRAIDHMTKDRIDLRKGYTVDNLCKACWLCNYAKGSFFTHDEWKLIAPTIIMKLKDAAKEGL